MTSGCFIAGRAAARKVIFCLLGMTVLTAGATVARAADLPDSNAPPVFTNAAPTDPITDYFVHWYDLSLIHI